MDWIASLLFFLFRGEIQGPASIANARFIDDTLSLSQRVVNRNCLERIGSNRSTAALRSSRSNRLMRELERAECSEGSERLKHLEPTENDLNRHSYQTSETF
jgi:hypothetical protein